MADTSVLLSGIEFKIRKLIEENLRLTKTVNDLQGEFLRLKEQSAALESQNLELIENINKKTIADSFSSEIEIEEGRKRIQALMQEIEQCIALINK